MPITVTVPRLGWNMEEGTFIEWLKADGEVVRPGDAVFRLEGEKSVEEVESLDGGVLHIPADGPKPGDRVGVGIVIGYLLQPGEAPLVGRAVPDSEPVGRAVPDSEPVGRAVPDSEPVGRAVPDSKPVPDSKLVPDNEPVGRAVPDLHQAEPAASPSVRRMARERGLELQQVRGSGPGGRILSEDVPYPPPKLAEQPVATISPRARRLASRLGIDWAKLPGSGRTGRIRERDVAAVANGAPSTSSKQVIPLTPIRKAIAARMMESRQTTAPVTLTAVVDATNLVNLREQFKAVAEGGSVPSYTDFLVKLSAYALQKHPLLAARWTDGGIVLAEQIDVGIAVDTDAGLFVPVIRGVESLGLRQIAARSRDLIDRARCGKLPARDMQGACFTITNLGAYGIDAFTPIINAPECAILGVGRIERKPVMEGDRVVGREQVTLSLTFDHRIVDGGPAARFVQTLARYIENPGPWLST